MQTHEFVDELWGSRPPVTALATLQSYIYKVRKQVLGEEGRAALHTKPNGYLLTVPDADLDLRCFEELAARGRTELDAGDARRASRSLGEALALWRGGPLAGVESGALLSAQVARLQESRLRTLELRIQADFTLGRHHELISELKTLCAAHPFNEGLHAKLMIALYRSGRRYEALELYQTFRRGLVDELGLEPSPHLGRLQNAVLSGAQTLREDDAGEPPVAVVVSDGPAPAEGGDPWPDAPGGEPAHEEPAPEGYEATPSPAQLPPDIGDFTGRAELLHQWERRFARSREDSCPLPVLWLSGPPGVGKTTLAVHLAHRLRHAFPDGQLYADLRGRSADPPRPREILASFLSAVGSTRHPRPSDDPDEWGKAFRTWCADRSLLLVLDDAADAAQVRPLLPGGGRCAALVTGAGHGLPGAERVLLGPLPPHEGADLLGRIIGTRRTEREPAAVEEIVRLCGGLPLVLRAVGIRLAALPSWPLLKLAHRLADARRRLDEVSLPGMDLRPAYAAGFGRLRERERIAILLLGAVGPEEFTSDDAARLLGHDGAGVEGVLAPLVEQHLLQVRGGDGWTIRYSVPELVRAYIRERLVGD
ncbi:SARP family transcriptional regulator [Streptomyces sp. LX-29]|uniref:AfsR/SARP family transcriptional regulator n=1 Tax=Streptomyces sp. LX-29 TaxID=2900152 RepID=UPI00240E2534|nr:BTAD domain-containing putative transcriptional regulator [Streptomyces sp. LX-29]WFB09102.1 SARP family transcriptional regulator [Streptomyces sp. LX-29]